MIEINGVSIFAVIMALISIIAGTRWKKARTLIKETREFMVTVRKAAEDKKFTRKEVVDCLKEGGDIFLALKKFW